MFFKKSFSAAKCKTLLRLATSRIKLLRNMRVDQLKKLKQELVKLLKANQEPSAHLKVEQIYREQSIMAAYEIIELFCQQIADQLPIIEAQKQCPIDLREAVGTIIYAAPRCSDILELQEIRRHLSAKFGKEFTRIAAELRVDCGVNRVVIEKLSVNRPSVEVKLKLMKVIAAEYKLDWDPTALKSQLLTPREDLLEGPSQFVGASRMSLNSSSEEPTCSPFSSELNQRSAPVDTRTPTAQSPVFSEERQYIPFVRPLVEVESPLSGSRASPQVLTPQRQDSSCRASHASSVTSHEYEECEDAQSALERRKSYKSVVSAAHKAAESAERAAAAARAAIAIAGKNLEETGSSTDNESESDGSEASQSRHLEPRRNPPSFDEAEEGRGLYRKQDSWNYSMHEGGRLGRSAAATSVSSSGRYAEDVDDDEGDDHHGSSNSVWHSPSMPNRHGRNQVSGLNSRFPSSDTLSYQDNTSFKRRSLETSRAAPVFDTEGWDNDSNNENADEAAPSIPVGPPTRAPPKLPERQTPCLTKKPSFTHPKLPDCDEFVAHFRALKAMNTKK